MARFRRGIGSAILRDESRSKNGAPTLPEPAEPSRSSTTYLLPALIFVAACLGLISDSFSVYHFPLDDAWIHQVYARSLAHGDGMAYNPGSQEAGSTSPLWAFVTAPAHWAGSIPAALVVKAIGVLLALGFVLAVASTASRLSGSEKVGVVAASLTALDPRLAFAALSGMEPVLLVALSGAACHCLVKDRPLRFLLCLGLMPVTRPEAVLFLPLALPIWWSVVRSAAWPRRVVATLLPVLPGALWVAFCLAVNGRPLPNTFYLKARPFDLGLSKLAGAAGSLTLGGPLPLWLCLLGLTLWTGLVLRSGKLGRMVWGLATAVPVVFLLAVLGSRAMYLGGYYWTRWLDPATLLLSAAAAIGLAHGAISVLPTVAGARHRTAVAWLGMALVLGAAFPTWSASFEDRRHHLSADSRVIALLNVRLGVWLAEHTPEDAVVGVNDAGALRYFSNRHCLDLLGLNAADIAFGRLDTRQAIDRSDWLAIFPSWFERRRLLGHIQDHFVPRIEARIPMEEFTLFDSPGQTSKVVFERRGDAADIATAPSGPESTFIGPKSTGN